MKLSPIIILLFSSTFQFKYAQQSTYHHSLDSLKKCVLTLPNAELGVFIQRSLSEIVFPHWYGTVWDYNGYTNTIKNVVIACGYFVKYSDSMDLKASLTFWLGNFSNNLKVQEYYLKKTYFKLVE